MSCYAACSEHSNAKGIVGYTEAAVVSSDFIGETRSTVFDASAGVMLTPGKDGTSLDMLALRAAIKRKHLDLWVGLNFVGDSLYSVAKTLLRVDGSLKCAQLHMTACAPPPPFSTGRRAVSKGLR